MGPPSLFSLFLLPHLIGYPMYLVSMERYFQAASGCGSFMAHGSFSTKHVGIYQNTASDTYYQYLCFPPEITPIWTSPPFTLQVLQQFLIDSGSIGEGFGVEIHVLLVGLQGYSHLLNGWSILRGWFSVGVSDMEFWSILSFISHVKFCFFLKYFVDGYLYRSFPIKNIPPSWAIRPQSDFQSHFPVLTLL